MNRSNAMPQDKAEPRVEPVARVGRIVAVTGAHAIILLDIEERPNVDAERSPEIGTLLKVDCATSISLALVSAMSSPMPSHNKGEQELRIVEVEFIGELPKDEHGRPKSFRRGISSYPSLGDTVYRASRSELSKAYACDSESSIRVGHIQQDPSIPAMIKIDEMLGKHFAVLGTTGTGKSCTVALILRRILEKNPQAHILLLDVHREYAQSFKGISEVITPDNMVLPFWLLNFEEAVEILIGQQPGRETDVEILRELIPMAKARYMNNQRRDKAGIAPRGGVDSSNIGVDTPLPYRTSDLIGILEEYIGKLELRGELAPYKRLKSRIETISRDPRYAFMFGSLTVQDNMAAVLARLFRIPVNGKPIAILELGGLPSEIINVVVSVLARLAFDFGVWSAGRIPITFVCEEAHRYVPIDKTLGFEPTKKSISRIAKEGRKYGVGLMLVSQRPSEIDNTILSQCGTMVALRLTNEADRGQIRSCSSDNLEGLFAMLPILRTGEALIVGEAVSMPVRALIDLPPLGRRPDSEDPFVVVPRDKNGNRVRPGGWTEPLGTEDYKPVVNAWRKQDPHAGANASHSETDNDANQPE